jgi:peptidyl-prolyl cis-trans isomerase C
MTSPDPVTRSRRPFKAARIALLGAAALLALSLAPGASLRAQSDSVVARVNGVEIHQSDLDLAEEEAGEQLAQLPPDARRDYLISYLTDMLLIDKAADDRHLSQSVEFQRKVNFAKNKLLMEALMQAIGKEAVTDAALRKVYDEARQQVGDQEEVHARHILVATEAEAKAILAELKGGADFAKLAKEKSKDPGATDGGDLGYFTQDQMVPEFSQVAFKLAKGQISDPVKTQFGWHIIKIEDRRKREIPPFEQVKGQLENYVVRKAQADFVAKLRQGAKIEKVEPPKN